MYKTTTYRKDGFNADPMITKRDLASRLGISERWIEYRMKDGLPHYRLGSAVRFQMSHVVAWLAQAQEAIR